MGRFKTTRKPRIVYKQARHFTKAQSPCHRCIVTLEIPKGTRVHLSSEHGRKRRAACAITKGIQYVPNNPGNTAINWGISLKDFQANAKDVECARSYYDLNYTYEVGKEQFPKYAFDEEYDVDCSSGIHFFDRIEDALAY